MGAGSIGCFVGGRLAAAGLPVHFIGRPRVLTELRAQGLKLSDFESGERRIEAGALSLSEAPPAGAPGLVLLCVKSAATAEAARQLAAVLPPGTLVLSLQNGIDNAAVAAAAAPSLRCLPGMVPFNVAQLAPGHFHRGSSGQLAAQDDPQLRAWQPAFERAGLPLHLHPDLHPTQWAKLLLNLNNPVNALSGLRLREQLLQPGWRQLTAALMQEGLAVLRAAGIEPAQLTPLPTAWLPAVMRLPTPLFRLVAARSLRVDPQARSSMADDLRLGRPLELDALCGAVQRLGRRHGVATPWNDWMLARLSDHPPRDDMPAWDR
ncbi:MAG: 2-dehydropantoate 2-reductase, partial [Gemmatimonas sp.]